MLPTSITPAAPKIATVASSAQVLNAWNWWLESITPRPKFKKGEGYVFDQKKWGEALSCLICADTDQQSCIATLYLTSQITANPNEIILMTQGQTLDINISEPGLDPQIKKVIENPEKFPHALSENLAFWAQIASIIKAGLFPTFIVTLPNAKPTDSGPDGLSLFFDEHGTPIVEIRSVKSSINDPSSKIASADFRKGVDPQPSVPPDNQLDEFYLVCKDGYGFVKLERLLVSAFQSMNRESTNILRIGLIRSRSRFNAMLVADDQYADATRFETYDRIPRLPTEKIATYIGSDNWQSLSEKVRGFVVNMLEKAGML
jgi:hypothetical protein